MTEIKVGDKFRGKDSANVVDYEITAVGRDNALALHVRDDHELSLPLMSVNKHMVKVEPFFEVGKTYEQSLVVFECKYIGEFIDDGVEKDRVAFGIAKSGGGFWWGIYDDFCGWVEVSDD